MSLGVAIHQQRHLDREIARILRDLTDRERPMQYPSDRAYQHWRRIATHTLTRFRNEHAKIESWLQAQERSLLRECYDLIKLFRHDGVEFDPPEIELVRRLDSYFSNRAQRSEDEQASQLRA